jgi:hypothetical protein
MTAITRTQANANERRAFRLIVAALNSAFNDGGRHGGVDANVVDAFTSRLADAGVDMAALDAVLAAGDPDLI